jgi:hypothetical protein
MKYSSFLKHPNHDHVRLRNRIWRLAVGVVLFLLLSNPASPGVFSQQDSGRKVKPSSSSTINLQEIEKREKESAQEQGRKKVENQNIIPPDLPVPKGAKGKTFRPSAGKKKATLISQSRKRIQRAGCRKTHRRSVVAVTP